jgi:hypothetical protein
MTGYPIIGKLGTDRDRARSEPCRCGHVEAWHADECQAPTVRVGDGVYVDGPCDCEAFDAPDDGRGQA